MKNAVLAKAYEMKENLRDLYNQETREEAELYLQAWCETVEQSGIQDMIQISKTVRRHKQGILSYIDNKITSGVVEGLNSVIQSIKTRARGYPNIANFKTMIYLKLGDFPILSRV
jgi:transposase